MQTQPLKRCKRRVRISTIRIRIRVRRGVRLGQDAVRYLVGLVIKLYRKLRAMLHAAAQSERGHKAYHCGHWCAHAAYLTAVFVEGHGFYAGCAGVMLAVVIVGTIFHLGE